MKQKAKRAIAASAAKRRSASKHKLNDASNSRDDKESSRQPSDDLEDGDDDNDQSHTQFSNKSARNDFIKGFNQL